MESNIKHQQVKSKERVKDFGEYCSKLKMVRSSEMVL